MNKSRYIYRGKYQNNWIYGAYLKFLPYTPAPIRDYDIPEKDYKHLIITEGFSDWNLPRDLKVYEVDKNTISQCTGIKNIQGKFIFEGDFIKLKDDTVKEVIWDECHFILKNTLIIIY